MIHPIDERLNCANSSAPPRKINPLRGASTTIRGFPAPAPPAAAPAPAPKVCAAGPFCSVLLVTNPALIEKPLMMLASPCLRIIDLLVKDAFSANFLSRLSSSVAHCNTC